MGLESTDYRRYDKAYRGRAYKLGRITYTTFIHLVKSKWSIGVMIMCYLFVFIHIMTFVLGAASLETSSESFFDNAQDVRFRIEPAKNETLMHEVPLGGKTVFNYDVKNVGSEDGDVEFYVQVPNPQWTTDVKVQNGKSSLEPGGWTHVRVEVAAPNNYADFSYINRTNATGLGFNLSQLGNIDLSSLGGIDLSNLAGLASGYLSQLSTQTNYIDSSNVSRTITFYAFYKGFSDRGAMDSGGPTEPGTDSRVADLRTASITSVVTLDKDSVRPLLETQGLPQNLPKTYDSNFNITVKPYPGQRIAEGAVKAGHNTTFDVTVTNLGNTTVKVAFDIIISQNHDIGWRYTTKGLAFDLQSFKGVIEVRPGHSRNFTLTVFSSNDSIRKSFNVMIIGTDVAHPEYQVSNATVCIVRVYEVIKFDNAKQSFFNLLWGGDLNYERYLWLIFLCALGGSGLIANDMRYNSISLYFSRPLTKLDYVVGKASGLFLFLTLITMAPAIILFITGILATSVTLPYIIDHLWILGAMLLSYVFTLILFVTVSLAFSSLTKKWMYAGVAIFSFFTLTAILGDLLHTIFNYDYFKLINLRADLRGLFKFMFDITYNAKAYGFDWYYPAAVVFGLFAVCLGIIIYKMWRSELSE